MDKKKGEPMKKKQGFTLIELLAVISILAFLGIIVGTSITEEIQKVRKNTSETQQKNIITAARNWAAENIYALPKEGDSIVISLHDLMSGGYIAGDNENQIIDTKTNQPFSKLRTLVTIQNKNGGYHYTIVTSYGKDQLNLNAPVLILKGKAEMEITGNFVDPGVIAYDQNGNEITEIETKIEDQNGVIVTEITQSGTYTITYMVTSSGQTTSIKRMVVVK